MQAKRGIGWAALVVALVAGTGFPQRVLAQATQAEPTLIDVRQANQYQSERVTIQGNIGRVIERSGSNAYELSDRFNGSIEVRTSSELPPKGVTYRVTGTVAPAEDRTGRPPVLIEDARVRWKGPDEVDPRSGVSVPPMDPPPNPIVIALIVATVVVLLALFGVLIFMFMRGNNQGTGPVPTGLPTMPATEGGTIKLAQPTSKAISTGTVKVLPGRFKVLAGEETIPEIRLFIGRDNHGREFTLGRIDNGAQIPANHIGFKTSSVSSKQGKLLCSPEGKYTIINYADPETKNPIVVNGRSLGAGEAQELRDQDTIEIGTVKLQYNAT